VVIMNTNEMLLGDAGSDEEEALAAGMASGAEDSPAGDAERSDDSVE
jgi:hypothetical protein